MVIVKAFFRYLRGELLNGFYIRKMNLIADKLLSMSELKAELLYWMNAQFNEKTGFNILRESDLKGIAQVAGVLSVRGLTDFLVGWFRLSESFVVKGKERSERGLLNQTSGLLEYVRTDLDTYVTDISTIATDMLRMSLIPEGEEPIGYVWGDSAAILLETGKVNEDLLRLTPPVGYTYNSTTHIWEWKDEYPYTGPGESVPPLYAPWYGDKYLPLTASYFMQVALPDNILTYLLQTHQMIKYNGLGLRYLLEATAEIIPDLITDLKIELAEEFSSWHHKMTFTRNEYNFSVNSGWIRFAAWGYFVRSKFPFIQFDDTGE